MWFWAFAQTSQLILLFLVGEKKKPLLRNSIMAEFCEIFTLITKLEGWNEDFIIFNTKFRNETKLVIKF